MIIFFLEDQLLLSNGEWKTVWYTNRGFTCAANDQKPYIENEPYTLTYTYIILRGKDRDQVRCAIIAGVIMWGNSFRLGRSERCKIVLTNACHLF